MQKRTTQKLISYGIIAGCSVALINSCTNNKSADQSEIVIRLKSQPGETLAQVGNISLSLNELRQDFLERQGSFRGAAHLNTEKKRNEYIENQVMQKAMLLEAIEQGYFEKDLEVKRNTEKFAVQKLMRDKLAQAQDSYVPTDEEMKEYYEKNPVHFNRDEALKVAYIAVPIAADAKGAKNVAQILHKEAMAKIGDANIKEFARLAISFAQSGQAGSNGKLETNESDYLEKEPFEAKFGKDSYEKIKLLESMGKIGPMLSTDKSFYIVMKTGHRKELHETFEEAKPKVAKRISFEKRGEVYEKYLASLREKYKIQINQERVAELSNDPNPPQNPAQAAQEAVKAHADASPQPKAASAQAPVKAQ